MIDKPPGWTTTTLGQLGRYLNGRAFKRSEWSERGRPIIRIQNLTGSSETVNRFEGDIEDRYVVRSGDLLVSWAATLGAYIWLGEEGVLNQHIFKVESYINRRFHKYLLDYKLTELMRHTHGSGMVHITRSRFNNVQVAVPDLPVQQQIVDSIEDFQSRLEAGRKALVDSRRRVAQLKQSYARSLILESGGNEFDFHEVFETVSDHGLRVAQRDYQPSGPIPVVDQGATHIGGYTEPANAFRGELPLIVFGDHTRRVKYVDFRFAVGAQGVKLLRVKPGVLPRYGYYLIKVANLTSRGYGRHFGLLRGTRFVVPDIDVQRSIVTRIDDLADAMTSATAQLQMIESREDRLWRAVLAAAFSGRLTRPATNAMEIEEFVSV